MTTVRQGSTESRSKSTLPSQGIEQEAPSELRLLSPTMLFYAIGAVTSAAKSVPITTFLMIFYNQVVGLPALSVSAILMASLICDAFFDPLIGHLSDNWRSRLGRRLPFMYMSAIPLTMAFILLWMPPTGWSSFSLHAYLAVCLIAVRFFDTFFELPHVALIPELSSGYHQRTRMFTVRSVCESMAGLIITLLAYNVFMKQSADGGGGVLGSPGYSAFALFCGGIIFLSICACTSGLQRLGPTLSVQEGRSKAQTFSVREMFHVVRNPSLGLLVGSMLLISIASGTGAALGLYWMIYYFGFSQAEITMLAVPATIGFVAVSATPYITRRLGKRDAAILLCWLYTLAGAVPMLARITGWVDADSPMLFVMVAVQCFIGPASITMVLISLSSMIADMVEDVEVRTHRRAEGLLLSSVGFVRKLMAGGGTLVAGLILTAVAFPAGAQRGQVPEPVMVELVSYYLSIKTALFVAATLVLLRYRYSERVHEANLTTLSRRR